MKRILTFCFLILFCVHGRSQSITKRGHPEHVIVGAGISAGITWLVYKNNPQKKWKAWAIGVGSTAALAGLKEWADASLLDGNPSAADFGYSVAGAAVGATLIITLTNRKKKTVGSTQFSVGSSQSAVLSSQYSVLSSQYSVLSRQYSVLSRQYSVLSRQYSVLSRQSSVLSRQYSVLSRQYSVLSTQSSVLSTQSSVGIPSSQSAVLSSQTFSTQYPVNLNNEGY